MNYIERETRIVNFILAPSNRYVGWVVYNNGYYFGSANTLSRLLHNVNLSIYRLHKITLRLRLASKPTEKNEVPLEKMTEHFKTGSYFNHTLTGRLTKEQAQVHKRAIAETESALTEPITEPEPISVKPSKREFICEERDGEMIVYELREFARYKLHKNNLTDKGL